MVALTSIGQRLARIGDGRFAEAELLPEKAREWMAANGCEILDVNTGHPRRKVDPRIRKAVTEALKHDFKYIDPQGGEDLRELLIRFFRQHNEPLTVGGNLTNVPLSKNDVVVTGTATEAFATLFQNFIGSGEVGLPKGYYNGYLFSAYAHASKVLTIDASPQNGFIPTYDQLIKFYLDHPEVKAIFLPSGNPTGVAWKPEQVREVARALNDINHKSNGNVLFVLDDPYIGLTEKPEDSIFMQLSEGAQRNFAYLFSGSKILSLTSMGGAVISANKDVIRSTTGHRSTYAPGSLPLAEPALKAGLDILITDYARAILEGKDPHRYGLIGKLAQSYLKEIGYVEKGFIALQESYGLNPPLVDHESKKALYTIVNLGGLIGRKIPNLSLCGGMLHLSDVLKKPPGSDGTITLADDMDIHRLLNSAGALKPGAKGIDSRRGELFGLPGYVRITCTGDRKHHEKLLTGVKELFDAIGLQPQKPFDYIARQHREFRAAGYRE